MLQEYFHSPKRIQALRDCPLGASFESFAQELSDAKYTRLTVRGYIRAAEHFIYWVGQEGVPIPSLDEAFIDRFDRHLKHCRCSHYGHGRRPELLRGAGMFFVHLRRMGRITATVAESAEPV